MCFPSWSVIIFIRSFLLLTLVDYSLFPVISEHVEFKDSSKQKDPITAAAEQRRTSIPDRPNIGTFRTAWSILRDCVGKDLTRIPVPVNFNEPLSFLQRITEDLEYAFLLDQAAEKLDSTEQMAYVAAYAISAYSTTADRTMKPFNPLLGETFEFDRRADLGWRCIAEQLLELLLLLALALVLLELKDGVYGAEPPSSAPLARAMANVLEEAIPMFGSRDEALEAQIANNYKCQVLCDNDGYNVPEDSYWCVSSGHCDLMFSKQRLFSNYRDGNTLFNGCCCCGDSQVSSANQNAFPFGGFGFRA